MKCRQALKLLYEYLDNQLDNESADQVKKHLAECKHCFETYTFEEHLNRDIRKKCREPQNSEVVVRLKEQVLHRINQLADSDDGNEAGESEDNSRRFFPFKRPVWALGFLTVIAIIILAFYFSSFNKNAWAGVFIENHESAIAGQTTMDIIADNPAVIDSCLRRKMDLPRRVFNPSQDYHFHSGRVDTIGAKPIAHILYNLDGHDVSIFVVKIDDFEMPCGMEKIPNTRNLHICTKNNYTIFVWNCKGFWYIATGDLDDDGMVNFVSRFDY